MNLYEAKIFTDQQQTKKKTIYITGESFAEAEDKLNKLHFPKSTLKYGTGIEVIKLVEKDNNNTFIN